MTGKQPVITQGWHLGNGVEVGRPSYLKWYVFLFVPMNLLPSEVSIVPAVMLARAW